MGRIEKPWGYKEHILSTQIDIGDHVGMLGIHRFVFNTDEMTSYAYHEKQADIIYVEKGSVIIRRESEMEELEKGEATVVRSGEEHQIQNISGDVAEVLEISFPYIPEDIVRVEDPYAEERDEETQGETPEE